MTKVEKTVLIARSAQQMFDLVDDCESYPKFLPWCSATEVTFRDSEKTVATLHISFLHVKARFTTENAKEIPVRMSLKLVDGKDSEQILGDPKVMEQSLKDALNQSVELIGGVVEGGG